VPSTKLLTRSAVDYDAVVAPTGRHRFAEANEPLGRVSRTAESSLIEASLAEASEFKVPSIPGLWRPADKRLKAVRVKSESRVESQASRWMRGRLRRMTTSWERSPRW